MNPIELAVLPVGEFENDLLRHEVEAIIGVFNELGASSFHCGARRHGGRVRANPFRHYWISNRTSCF